MAAFSPSDAGFASIDVSNPCFGGECMNIGTYTGDGGATKAITGVGFRPRVLLVEFFTDKRVYLKTTNDTTGAMSLTTLAYVDDVIISLDADGFTMGDTDNMNKLDEAYAWIAWG